jgi:DNA-binding LacI/PurR family transcriptional regulator
MADPKATRAIAFLSPYVSGSYFGTVMTGAMQAAQRHGVRLMVFQETAARLDRSRLGASPTLGAALRSLQWREKARRG